MPVPFAMKTAISTCLVALMLSPLPALAASTPKTPQYLPPIAPKMDRSYFEQEPASQREVAKQYDDSSPQRQYQTDPEPVDRVKELLRGALQKHNAGDKSGAQKLFKQALSIDPRNADANFNLGAMAEDAGDLAAALGYYKAASLASPNDGEVTDALASVQDRLRQKEQERTTAMQVEKKNQLRSVAQEAASAYKAGQYDKAVTLLEGIDRQAPGDANVKYGLGQAYRGKGDMDRARANLQAATSMDPSNSLYRTTLAEIDRQLQQQVASQPSAGSGGSGGRPGALRWDDQPPSGMRDYGNQNMPPIANDYRNAGDLTPFNNSGDPSTLYGHAYDNAPRGISLGGLGSALGIGGLGMGLGSMMNGGMRGYSDMPTSGRGTRLVRGAVTGGLTGAAIGALSNMGRGSGGMKSGAMKGGMAGALFGMLSSF